MTEFTLPKSISGEKKRDTSIPGNLAYALLVLFCFWTGAQLLNLLVHTPEIFEHLVQMKNSGQPRVEMGLAVGTLFGLIPFLAGCAIFGVVVLILRRRRCL